MNIRWKDFFKDHGIHFVEQGPNVAKGNIYIQCPWCGPADHSEHMGVKANGLYGCWRDDSHRGGSPARLVAELLSVGFTEAQRVLSSYGEGLPISSSPDKGFRDSIREKLQLITENVPIIKDIPPPSFDKPREWMRIDPDNPFVRFAYNYLIGRGFTPKVLQDIPLYACQVGQDAYRVIFPVYEDGKLVSWTGRATNGAMGLRYKSLAALPPEQGGWQIKDFVWGYDYAQTQPNGPLVVCEGPMDALKLNQFLGERGRAVALFNSSLGSRQMRLLAKLAEDGRQLVICMDPDAMSHTLKIWQAMRVFTKVDAVYLPEGADPGALDEVGFMQAFKRFIS